MSPTVGAVPAGVPTAAGAIGIAVTYGAGIRSWKLGAIVLAAVALVGLDVLTALRD